MAELSALYMKKPSLDDLDALAAALEPLPPGVTLVTHRPGEEREWEALIERCFDAHSPFDAEIRDRAGWEPNHTFYLLKDGKRIATATGINYKTLPEGGWMHFVAVDPAYRGMHLATHISLAVLQNLRERGYREVGLYTNDWRLPAIKTYLKLGFLPVMADETLPARWEQIMAQIKA